VTAVARPYLKLVRDRAREGPASPVRFEQMQEPLLPITDRTLGICTADGMDESILTSLVENLRPSLIVDFRTAPRFDFGTFNRRRAFDLFESVSAQYIDLGHASSKAGEDAYPMADALSQAAIAKGPVSRTTAVLAFVDAEVDFEKAGLVAIQRLRDLSGSTWELLLFGRIERDDQSRKVLFINHANPEDNEFVFWLQTQLTRLGYETWSDITQLKAGEVFWDSIEDVIRHKAARVISVVSRKALQKPGVLDEISLAVSVERTRQLPGFVIPIRIDDIAFSEFRANIARKNILDFYSVGWAAGLSRLAETLSRDRVPRARQLEGLSLGTWWAQQKPPTLSISHAPETLVSNRFRLTSVPTRIYTFAGTPTFTGSGNHSLVPFRGIWLSFLSQNEMQPSDITGITQESVMSAADLFAGNLSLTSHLPIPSRQRLLHRMLNKQWETFLLSRGLCLYHQTGSQPNPYVPDGVIPNNTAYFADKEGIQRRRILVGHSLKKKLYWHLAPLGSFSTSSETALNLKMRVLFSEDGQSKWPSSDRMRTMRRSFCKNWWNDRWRTLQSAFMSWLSSGSAEISIYVGDGGRLTLQSAPMGYESPISIEETHAQGDEEAIAFELDGDTAGENADDWSDLDTFSAVDAAPEEGERA
jgi:TIR domain